MVYLIKQYSKINWYNAESYQIKRYGRNPVLLNDTVSLNGALEDTEIPVYGEISKFKYFIAEQLNKLEFYTRHTLVPRRGFWADKAIRDNKGNIIGKVEDGLYKANSLIGILYSLNVTSNGENGRNLKNKAILDTKSNLFFRDPEPNLKYSSFIKDPFDLEDKEILDEKGAHYILNKIEFICIGLHFAKGKEIQKYSFETFVFSDDSDFTLEKADSLDFLSGEYSTYYKNRYPFFLGIRTDGWLISVVGQAYPNTSYAYKALYSSDTYENLGRRCSNFHYLRAMTHLIADNKDVLLRDFEEIEKKIDSRGAFVVESRYTAMAFDKENNPLRFDWVDTQKRFYYEIHCLEPLDKFSDDSSERKAKYILDWLNEEYRYNAKTFDEYLEIREGFYKNYLNEKALEEQKKEEQTQETNKQKADSAIDRENRRQELVNKGGGGVNKISDKEIKLPTTQDRYNNFKIGYDASIAEKAIQDSSNFVWTTNITSFDIIARYHPTLTDSNGKYIGSEVSTEISDYYTSILNSSVGVDGEKQKIIDTMNGLEDTIKSCIATLKEKINKKGTNGIEFFFKEHDFTTEELIRIVYGDGVASMKIKQRLDGDNKPTNKYDIDFVFRTEQDRLNEIDESLTAKKTGSKTIFVTAEKIKNEIIKATYTAPVVKPDMTNKIKFNQVYQYNSKTFLFLDNQTIIYFRTYVSLTPIKIAEEETEIDLLSINSVDMRKYEGGNLTIQVTQTNQSVEKFLTNKSFKTVVDFKGADIYINDFSSAGKRINW